MNGESEIHVVVKGLIMHQDQFLIVKRSDEDEIGAGTWECPGGKIEFEEEIIQALIREINEETGLVISVDHILYATTFFTDPTRKVVLLTYLCQADTYEVQLSEEHSAYKWVTQEELKLHLPQTIIENLYKAKEWSIR
ncbi:NUDIX domain-containing protein [Fictibacillus nanhaiensis]|uniref:NUDIX domain-containing protein n=1 Tax=Fictibacillus nanhaiensis TaxID=742169 RepID=A0ABS2ZTR8_9BACL|nr:NUDIX domain-containing protein [Fictibacillus nanhaiensis]